MATKKMRALTYNYDIKSKALTLYIFFDSELVEDEIEEYDEIYTYLISSFWDSITCRTDAGGEESLLKLKQFYCKIEIIPSKKTVLDRMGNLGWYYLRKEYEE